MNDLFSPAILLVIVPALFAGAGGYFAYGRGKNPLLWGFLSAIFPVCVMIVWFEKPKKEVEGHFRKCGSCGEWIKWQESPCRYCGAGQ